MILVTQATPDEYAPAAAVLAEAFAEDPVLRRIVPSEGDSNARLRHLFLAVIRSGPGASGVVDVARRPGEDRIIGAAAWDGPEARQGALGRQLRQLPLFLRSLGVRGLPRAIATSDRLATQRPPIPHWYLGEIGVSPEARGLGVGATLLRTRLRAIENDGLPVYLESSTPQNRRLYARHGFRELALIS